MGGRVPWEPSKELAEAGGGEGGEGLVGVVIATRRQSYLSPIRAPPEPHLSPT